MNTQASSYIVDKASSSDSENVSIEDEELYLGSSKFESSDALLKSARSFYSAKGYGLSIRSSKPNKIIILQCSRGSSYRDTLGINDKRKKKTISILIDCPFQIEGQRRNDGSWILKTHNLKHNHEPATDMYRHPSFRRLSSDELQTVKDMTLAGIPPIQILSSLRQQNPNLQAISRTTYNVKKKMQKDNLGNRSIIGALFEELVKCGFTYDILHNSEGRITRMFIAHPLSIKLAKIFSNTFVMDCTYKPNIYNMPLLDIIGMSCFNSSFYSGFVYLEKEDEENYIWALNVFKKILGQGNLPSVIMSDRELTLMNGIRNVFPTATNLLCVWHIEKNVVANCKKYFERAEDFDNFILSWKNMVYSIREDIFESNWREFELLYKGKKKSIEYIKKTWFPWKEKFISVWTKKYLHFGSRTSSRAKGAHAKLKMYLQASTCDFHQVEQKITLAVKHEFHEIKMQLASEKIQGPHDCNMPLFRELLCRVSRVALEEIYQQYKKIKAGTMSSCTGNFMAVMGFRCAHKIYVCQGTGLTLDLIHPQWRIDNLSLNSEDDSQNDDEDRFNEVLNELSSKYNTWPLSKKERATSMITQFLSESDMFFEPVIQRPKGRPPKQHKKEEE